MDTISKKAVKPGKGDIQKYVLTDVSSCTFTFSDGAKSNVKTPEGKEFVIVKFIPKSDKHREFQEGIMEHYMYAKDVQDLAEKCGYACLKTFTRHFKKAFRSTPYKWMLDRRMEDVKYLVLNSTLPISEIAQIFNFKSVSHLVNLYSDKFGIAPNKNRNLVNSNS